MNSIKYDIAVGIIVAVFTGILFPIIRDIINKSISKKKVVPKVLFEIDDMLSEIKYAISYKPHKVNNKDAWIKRLNDFADNNKDILDDLQYAIKKIAWKLNDSNFDHDSNNIAYCCDELRIDISLLQFAILEIKLVHGNISSKEKSTIEKEFIKENWLDLQKKVLDRMHYLFHFGDNENGAAFVRRVSQMHYGLKNGSAELSEQLAMGAFPVFKYP